MAHSTASAERHDKKLDVVYCAIATVRSAPEADYVCTFMVGARIAHIERGKWSGDLRPDLQIRDFAQQAANRFLSMHDPKTSTRYR